MLQIVHISSHFCLCGGFPAGIVSRFVMIAGKWSLPWSEDNVFNSRLAAIVGSHIGRSTIGKSPYCALKWVGFLLFSRVKCSIASATILPRSSMFVLFYIVLWALKSPVMMKGRSNDNNDLLNIQVPLLRLVRWTVNILKKGCEVLDMFMWLLREEYWVFYCNCCRVLKLRLRHMCGLWYFCPFIF